MITSLIGWSLTSWSSSDGPDTSVSVLVSPILQLATTIPLPLLDARGFILALCRLVGYWRWLWHVIIICGDVLTGFFDHCSQLSVRHCACTLSLNLCTLWHFLCNQHCSPTSGTSSASSLSTITFTASCTAHSSCLTWLFSPSGLIWVPVECLDLVCSLLSGLLGLHG